MNKTRWGDGNRFDRFVRRRPRAGEQSKSCYRHAAGLDLWGKRADTI